MPKELFNYNAFKLLSITGEYPDKDDLESTAYIRVSLPASPGSARQMSEMGLCFADRTLAVSIPLLRSKVDFSSLILMNVFHSDDYTGAIAEIAKASFPNDRRFHISLGYDDEIASLILEDWVSKFKSPLVCIRNNDLAGFLALEESDRYSSKIILAAAAPQYRLMGAAVSLYAYAAKECKENGKHFLRGRVSTQNTASMNLLLGLNARFSEPVDIYIKDGRFKKLPG